MNKINRAIIDTIKDLKYHITPFVIIGVYIIFGLLTFPSGSELTLAQEKDLKILNESLVVYMFTIIIFGAAFLIRLKLRLSLLRKKG